MLYEKDQNKAVINIPILKVAIDCYFLQVIVGSRNPLVFSDCNMFTISTFN